MNENSKIENQVYNAVSMIVEDRLTAARFDRTVAASIISCEDQATGVYKVRYQDAIYRASASDTSITYPEGARVYILVPEGDFLKSKKIIGLVENTTIETDSLLIMNTYLPLGNSCGEIKDNVELSYSSYQPIDTEIELYNAKAPGESILSINNNALKQQLLDGATNIRARMDFKTLMPKTQKRGNFGLVVIIKLANDRTTKINLFTKDMSGDPYCSIDYITQYKNSEEIKAEEFIEIERIYYFANGFDTYTQEEKWIKDIFLKNFQIYGVAHNSSDLFSSYLLDIKEKNNKGNEINQDQTSLTFIAELYQRLQPTVTDENAKYYWFKQNGSVKAPTEITAHSNNPKYHEFAGEGWECLNTGAPVLDNATGLYYIDWTATSREITISNENLKIETGLYKCICDYDGIRTGKDFVVKNNLAPYQIKIEKEREVLTSESDEVVLKATVSQRDSNGKYQPISNGFKLEWSVYPDSDISSEGILDENEKVRSEITVRGQDINLHNKYICTVWLDDDSFIGTYEVTIRKEKQLQDSAIYLKLTNGNQMFLYNEAGLSPIKNPLKMQVVQPLGFSLYKVEKGREINVTSEVDSSTVEWRIPRKNTLLESTITTNPASTDDYYVVTERGMLEFKIKDNFAFDAINNTIRLKVTYENQPVITTTSFQFNKEGTPGTNGTDVIAIIEPVDNDNDSNFLGYPTIFYYNSSKTAIFNKRKEKNNICSTVISNENPSLLKVSLFNKGEEISITNTEKVKKITWSVKTMDNNINPFFEIGSRQGQCFIKNINSITDNNFYSVISCEIKYVNDAGSEQYIYAEYPLAWCFINASYGEINYQYQFDLTKGYNAVQYKEDGTSPSYNNSNFSVQILKSILNNGQTTIEQEPNSNYKFTWGSLNSYLIQDNADESKFTPKLQYDGTVSNTGIKCIIQKNNSTVATIYAPIYLYLNKFAYSSLNGWDGNGIKINEDGQNSYLLSPQVGAGSKNEDNQFSGVLMGKLQHYDNQKTPEHGLMGFHEGERSFFLNAADGTAVFGKNNSGQIIVDPRDEGKIIIGQEGAGQITVDGKSSKITGGRYSLKTNNSPGSGMEIDLQKPSITYGNQNFSVDANGFLNAQNAKISGEITASSITITPEVAAAGGLTTAQSLSTALEGYVNTDALTDYTKTVDIVEKTGKVQIHGGNIAAGTVAASTFIAGRGGNLYATGYDTFEHIQNNTNRICGLHSLASASVEIVSTEAYYGSKSLKIHSNGSTAHVWLGDSETDHKGKIPTTNGQKYIVSAYVKGSASAVSGKMEAFSFATRNTIVNNSSFLGRTEFTVGGNWTRVYFPCVGDGNFLSLRFYNTTTGSDLYVDAIQIEKAEEKNIEPSEFNPAATTVINGSHISTGSISASSIKTEEIEVLGKVTGGQFSLGSGNFIVDENGNLTAKDATLSGAIKVDDKSSVGTWNLHGGVNTGEVAYLYHSYRKDGSVARTDDPLEDGGPYSGFVMNCNTRTDSNGKTTYRNPTFFHIFAHHPGDSSEATIRLDHNGDARIGLRSNGTYTLRVNTGNTLNKFSQTDTPKRSEALSYGVLADTEVRINGNIYFNGAPLHTSDRRLKENIVELQNSKYIQFFDNLNPVSFNMKDTSNYVYRKHLGFIAQEVQEALEKSNLTEMDFSGLVQDRETGFYTLNYNHFIALNTAKIKQLEAVIKEQQKQIDELKSKLA